MASWTFTDNPSYITVTRDSASFDVSKYSNITMSVAGDILTFRYAELNTQLQTLQSANKAKNKVNLREWNIDYNDVTSPTFASAAALQAQIEVWLAVTSSSIVTIKDYTNMFLLMGG